MLLLRFIRDVASTGFPKEAELMLKGAAVPRLSHILRSVQKNKHSRGWIREMDGAHLPTWLRCLTASEDMEHVLGTKVRGQLSDLLDNHFGVVFLQLVKMIPSYYIINPEVTDYYVRLSVRMSICLSVCL